MKKIVLLSIVFLLFSTSLVVSQSFDELIAQYEKACTSNNDTEQVRILTLILEKYPKKQPEISLYNRGIAYFNLEDYDKAVSDFTKAISIKPDYADAYKNRSIIYYTQSKYVEAISDCKKVIELSPDNAEMYGNIGYSYLRLKDYLNAILNFNKCIEKDNTSFDPMLGLAITYSIQGDIEYAKKYLNDAIKTEPRLSEGMAGLKKLENEGYIYMDEDKAEMKKLFEMMGK